MNQPMSEVACASTESLNLASLQEKLERNFAQLSDANQLLESVIDRLSLSDIKQPQDGHNPRPSRGGQLGTLHDRAEENGRVADGLVNKANQLNGLI